MTARKLTPQGLISRGPRSVGASLMALFWGAGLVTSSLLGLLLITSGCQGDSPQVGSQTNWLKACDSSSDCGDLVCLCGTCTLSCDGGNDCGDLDSDSCVLSTDEGASAVCDGLVPTAGMCLPRCEDEPCPEGTECLLGICIGTQTPTVSLEIDTSTRFQTLYGFGASLAYSEDYIVNHPEKEALFDAMFAESGFDMIRMINRAAGGVPASQVEIIEAATTRLGRSPLLYMTSGSPPEALKANANRYCINSDPDCTLIRDGGGAFDYAGFAEYWRSSLEEYAGVGIVPDFVSIQNNSNWVPPSEEGVEACRFLPTEGMIDVALPDGTTVTAPFPGYEEAMEAVSAAVETLPVAYSFVGPETGVVSFVSDYEAVLGAVGAVGVSFYSLDPKDLDREALEQARTLSGNLTKPLIQSEVYAAAPDAAVFIHHALVSAGASGYLQQGFAGQSTNPADPVLIGGDDTTFDKHDTYYVMSHFARFTDPGWVRVDTGVDDGVLSSAWLAPDADALTVVLVNPASSAVNVEVTLESDDLLASAHVYRTVLGGTERFVDLGLLPDTGTVRMPPGSVVTVATP